MKIQAQSPTPTKNVVNVGIMNFPTAIERVIQGQKIYRLEWNEENLYGFLNAGILSLHKPDGNNYQWIINDGDLFATDWMAK